MLLCFDGGGSKSRMLLADGELNLIGDGASLGTNVNHTPLAEARANLCSCLEQTIAGREICRIDEAVATIVGPVEELEALLEPYGCGVERFEEPESGLWAGVLRPSGYVALSGTGSDVFHISAAGGRVARHGGWGLLLGDEGSGAWIGQQALRAVARDYADVGPHTLMSELAKEALGVTEHWGIVRKMYASPSPIRYLAAFTPHVARAAREGDELALSLFAQAGEHMARQLLWLIEKQASPEDGDVCVLAGGAWKAHPVMRETFAALIREEHPEIGIREPYFEPVMAGVSRALALKHPDWTEAARLAFLTERFGEFRIYKEV